MRRRWMTAVAVSMAGALMLSACGGDAKKGADILSGPRKVEVFSWWTGPGEADGLKAMRAIFAKQNPKLQFYDAAVAGGAGDLARALLASKLQANQPPDTFQGHAGAELQGYINSGKLESLNFLYNDLKLKEVFPKQLVDQLTVEGQVYSVPVNIHRSNVLWYSPSVLKEAGIAAPPKTMDEFIIDLEKVKRAGKIPLSIGSEWTLVHLLESVLCGSLGTDVYNQLWTPTSDWSTANVTKALENYGTVLSYAGTPQNDWQPAAKQVADGEAAFNIMGDWAYGYFRNPAPGGIGKEPHKDFDWAASPGTDGTFMWLSDSFTLPKGAPNRDGAIAWLKVAASKQGQDAFNPLKGSIPARTDADKSLYKDYLAWSLQQWAADKLAGSIQHGVVASDPWRQAITDAVDVFQKNHDVATFQQALVAAAKSSDQ
ncbi:carbohydrate ABC transporter substrate-binding protein [Microbispora sp. RL4-1S]|uniref:Probable sugar-binding periplasmic protein n=1 Tax=Microbispora oryzae TaxID=2806554 RepID=A0A941AHY5_9ACTN|nr:ABC transporter substrate-binding protein [Microbispora oryzae]MBP2703212.1 carbohydrate ABC transporter substrate-binding protein [Microbispora oryzae]